MVRRNSRCNNPKGKLLTWNCNANEATALHVPRSSQASTRHPLSGLAVRPAAEYAKWTEVITERVFIGGPLS